MHITLETDYAMRIVFCLCKAKGRMDAKSVSEKTGVTLRFSLKILRKLVAAGIIRSYKGTQGGYELAREPKEITFYDVLSTIEGPVVLARCSDSSFCCTNQQGEECEFRKVLDHLSDTIRSELKSYHF